MKSAFSFLFEVNSASMLTVCMYILYKRYAVFAALLCQSFNKKKQNV